MSEKPEIIQLSLSRFFSHWKSNLTNNDDNDGGGRDGAVCKQVVHHNGETTAGN